MGGGVEGGGEGGGGSGDGGGGGGGEGGGGGKGAHVADVMVPSELQMCVPVPAPHACTVGWCVVARGGVKACGAGTCGGTVLGRGLVWRLGHGAWGHV